jgi:Rieske Fe-S protein
MSNHPISRRPLLLGSGAAAFLTLLPFKALAAGPNAVCTKVGQKAIVKGRNYICVKSKGKLNWKLLTPAKPPIVVHPSSTPTSTPASLSGFLVAHISDLQEGQVKVINANDLQGRSVGVALILVGKVVTAHSVICTHRGCSVQESNNQLACPCHGSIFNGLTGSVEQGPAQSPLPEYKVAQIDDGIYIVGDH